MVGFVPLTFAGKHITLPRRGLSRAWRIPKSSRPFDFLRQRWAYSAPFTGLSLTVVFGLSTQGRAYKAGCCWVRMYVQASMLASANSLDRFRVQAYSLCWQSRQQPQKESHNAMDLVPVISDACSAATDSHQPWIPDNYLSTRHAPRTNRGNAVLGVLRWGLAAGACVHSQDGELADC